MQIRVREQFARLKDMDKTVPWTMINAAQSQEDVQSDIWEKSKEIIDQCADQPIKAMWQKCIYED
jgi:thymidylate kinase